MKLLAIIFILLILIVVLIVVAVAQLRAAGIKVTDFYSFVKANESLDQLYIFAQKYNKMTPQEQLIYLIEAERMLAAFDKVPEVMWADEQGKYNEVVSTYQKIRLDRWNREAELKQKKLEEENKDLNKISTRKKSAKSKAKTIKKNIEKSTKKIKPKEIKYKKAT